MDNATREWVVAALRPPYVALRFLVRIINKGLFWWLDPLLQKRKNASLEDDVQANLYFLYAGAEVVRERWTTVHPFDYAVLRLLCKNIYFCFARGQGQLNVTVSPRHLPKDTHELQIVMAVLDSKDVTQQMPTRYLSNVADLLRTRLDALNNAFSESQYAELTKELVRAEKSLDGVRREAEWEINKRLYS